MISFWWKRVENIYLQVKYTSNPYNIISYGNTLQNCGFSAPVGMYVLSTYKWIFQSQQPNRQLSMTEWLHFCGFLAFSCLADIFFSANFLTFLLADFFQIKKSGKTIIFCLPNTFFYEPVWIKKWLQNKTRMVFKW